MTDRMLNKNVIVRGDGSGVFVGTLIERNGTEVMLINMRKLYEWAGANTVEQLAIDGTLEEDGCKFTQVVKFESIITDAVQVLSCTAKAYKKIMGVKVWKYQP